MMARLDADPDQPPPKAVARARSVLRPPATEGEIEAAEDRLGVALPPSYRAFLSTSNGAYAGPDGPVRAGWRVRSRKRGLALITADEIRPMEEVDAFRYRMWTEMPEFAGAAPIEFEGDDVQNFHALRRGALVIGGDTEALTLLVRVGRSREWQLWSMYKEFTIGWSSFGAWLDTIVNPASLPPIDDLLEQAASGSRAAQHQLARVHDAAAVPALVDALDRYPMLAPTLVQVLGRLDGDDAARALARYLHPPSRRPAPDEAARALSDRLDDREAGRPVPPPVNPNAWTAARILQKMKSPVAADVLYEFGACYELAQRGDPRAGSLAVHALENDLTTPTVHAVYALGWLGDPTYVPAIRAEAEKARNVAAETYVGQINKRGYLWAIGTTLADLGDEEGIAILRELADAGDHHAQMSLEGRFPNGPRDPSARARVSASTEG